MMKCENIITNTSNAISWIRYDETMIQQREYSNLMNDSWLFNIVPTTYV